MCPVHCLVLVSRGVPVLTGRATSRPQTHSSHLILNPAPAPLIPLHYRSTAPTPVALLCSICSPPRLPWTPSRPSPSQSPEKLGPLFDSVPSVSDLFRICSPSRLPRTPSRPSPSQSPEKLGPLFYCVASALICAGSVRLLGCHGHRAVRSLLTSPPTLPFA